MARTTQRISSRATGSLTPAGVKPPTHMNVAPSRTSEPVGSPDSAKNLSSAPGPDRSGRSSQGARACGARSCEDTPGAYEVCSPAARRPSSGETVYGGNTVALPPPRVRATSAFGPMTATWRTRDRDSGSKPSLRASTNPAAAAARSSAAVATESGGSARSAGAAGPPSRAPTRAASRRIRSTLSSISASSTLPFLTASSRASPHGPYRLAGPGMARSRAAAAVPSVDRAAVQSDITRPS